MNIFAGHPASNFRIVYLNTDAICASKTLVYITYSESHPRRHYAILLCIMQYVQLKQNFVIDSTLTAVGCPFLSVHHTNIAHSSYCPNAWQSIGRKQHMIVIRYSNHPVILHCILRQVLEITPSNHKYA
jgi:hypothetical protein